MMERVSPDTPRDAVPSIAVLPFADLSPKRDQGYFCEGVAEEILNALVRIRGLRVVPRLAGGKRGYDAGDIQALGQQLGVGTVLEGSVRKDRNRLRITVRLSNVADGFCLWSDRYDRGLEDIFAIQDEIAENTVRVLRGVFSDEDRRRLQAMPRAKIEAYEYYLRGRRFFYRQTKQDHDFARQMFLSAISVDPGFASAYAGLSDACLFLYKHFDHSPAYLEEAGTASARAVELAPEMGETHASRAFYFSLSGQDEEAEHEFETALRLNPNLYEVYFLYGVHLGYLKGRLERAADIFRRASEVHPGDFQATLLHAALARGTGQVDEARQAYRRGLRHARTHLELNPDDVRAIYLSANALVALGRSAEGFALAERALELSSPPSAMLLYNMAAIYALAGDVERGMEYLEDAVRAGYGQREPIENDPDLTVLRSHPRYQALLRRWDHYDVTARTPPPPFSFLTSRERDVLELMAQGLSNDQIAEHLFISTKTVRNHITHIFSKLEVGRRAEAIVRAREAGFGGASKSLGHGSHIPPRRKPQI